MRVFVLLSILSIGVSAEALELTCPERLSTKQEILNAPKSWDITEKQYPSKLEGVYLYYGHPKGMASLKGDKRSRKDDYTFWTLSPESEYWIECSYANTTVTLSRPLPKELKSCKVTYDKDVWISGNPQVRSINCE